VASSLLQCRHFSSSLEDTDLVNKPTNQELGRKTRKNKTNQKLNWEQETRGVQNLLTRKHSRKYAICWTWRRTTNSSSSGGRGDKEWEGKLEGERKRGRAPCLPPNDASREQNGAFRR
jgi:hypothetical protein